MSFRRYIKENIAETGKPITLKFSRNTEKSPPAPSGDPYQQKIEPHGTYLSHNDSNMSSEDAKRINRELGVIEFKNPLVMPFNKTEGGYDENSWKMVLFKEYKKKGRTLTKELIRKGFDGVITYDKYGFSEIVSFKDFK